jgi:hypothetical protein
MCPLHDHAASRGTIAMNAPNLPLLPEILLGPQPADQPNLDLASEGVQRYVWQSAYGAMLIEVRDGAAYINGQRVTSVHELRTDGSPA